jgi:hypothetical protein
MGAPACPTRFVSKSLLQERPLGSDDPDRPPCTVDAYQGLVGAGTRWDSIANNTLCALRSSRN